MASKEDDGAGRDDLTGVISPAVQEQYGQSETERRLTETILQSASEGIFGMDKDANCTFINEAALDYFGRSVEECIGHNIHYLAHYKRPDGSHYPIEECPIYCAFRSGQAVHFVEETYWHKDGHPLTAFYSCSPIVADGEVVGGVVVIVDVHERRQAEAERDRLLASEQERSRQLRALADTALLVNSAASSDEMINIITEQARRIIGAHQSIVSLTIDQNLEQAITAVSLSEKYEQWANFDASLDGKGIYSLVSSTNRPMRLTQEELEAHTTWEGLSGYSDTHPPLRGWLAVPLVARDGSNLGLIQLSDKYEGEFSAEDEALMVQLAQITAVALENARLYREAQGAVRAREELLAMVSHDLKNSLVSVRGYAQLLQRRVVRGVEIDREKLATGLAQIEQSTAKMNTIVNELLDFARLQAGQPLELQYQRSDLVALVRRIAAEYQRSTDTHIILVESNVPDLIGEWDAPRLERAIANLLSNAIKYSPHGGEVTIKLDCEQKSVEQSSKSSADKEVDYEQAQDWALLAVKDSGIGIPATDLPHIFKRFHRANNVTGDISGTGLGLATARQIVEQHGGAINVDSREGEGATFTILLPIKNG